MVSNLPDLFQRITKGVLLLGLIILLEGCSSDNKEIKEKVSSSTVSEQEFMEKNNEATDHDTTIPYNEYEYLDVYTDYNNEFTEISTEAFNSIEELSLNFNLINNEKWMNKLEFKKNELNELNKMFNKLSKENRVPEIYIKLHKLTQENIENSIIAINNFVEGVKTKNTELLDEVVNLSEVMALNVEAMILEDHRIASYLQEKIKSEEEAIVNSESVEEKENVGVNSEKETNKVELNPGDYNAKGEYKPVESMTQEEIQVELGEFIRGAIGSD